MLNLFVLASGSARKGEYVLYWQDFNKLLTAVVLLLLFVHLYSLNTTAMPYFMLLWVFLFVLISPISCQFSALRLMLCARVTCLYFLPSNETQYKQMLSFAFLFLTFHLCRAVD